MAAASDPNAELMALVRAIAAGDSATILAMLDAQPELSRACVGKGATRKDAKANFLDAIGHYIYQGDTALHIAAAAYRTDIVRRLIAGGSDVRAKNRLGAEPLHLAAMGMPGAPYFDPSAQAATISCLIEAGAEPNARDRQGVAPLHRAVRTRCAAAVAALLARGADPGLANKSGSTPIKLAEMTTGRGGSGSPEAKTQQQEIVQLLRRALA
jgi:Ankyrin repeats (many copies)